MAGEWEIWVSLGLGPCDKAPDKKMDGRMNLQILMEALLHFEH